MEDRTMSPLGSTEGGVVDKRQMQRESDPTTETVDDEVSADDRRHTPSAVILEPEQPLSEAMPPPHSESSSDHGGRGGAGEHAAATPPSSAAAPPAGGQYEGKIKVNLQAVGSAPILKKTKFAIGGKGAAVSPSKTLVSVLHPTTFFFLFQRGTVLASSAPSSESSCGWSPVNHCLCM